MAIVTHTLWALKSEAYLGRIARRSKSPLEFIERILTFVAHETHAKRAVFYLYDDDAPTLTSIKYRQSDVQAQLELVATASYGFEDTSAILHHLFLTSSSTTRIELELKKALPKLDFESVETIPFASRESQIRGIIVIYTNKNKSHTRAVSLKLRRVLNEAAIIIDFVIDRFLQKDLVDLNKFGLASVNFDTSDGMCRMIEETRKLLGVEGISFFVLDATTDAGDFWLTACSPSPMPSRPIGYSSTDLNLTSRALSYKKPTIIHSVKEVRKRISGLQIAKWCELPRGVVDESVLFVPVIRSNCVVALLRCTNKIKGTGEPLFNRLDVRRSDAFAGLLHTWQSSIENEVRFTSSLLDIAHELRTSAAGIKARAQYAALSIKAGSGPTDIIIKKLGDIALSMDSSLEMMSILAAAHYGTDMASERITPFKPYSELCVPVVNSFRPEADKRALRFRIFGEHHLSLIYADVKDFLHIMQNLISNAVKYTHRASEIFISLESPRPLSRYAAIKVGSQSYKIRPDEREQIFRFRYRALSVRESVELGQGRGLAIARAKARRFKGDLVHSYGNTQDINVFTLQIPRTLLRPITIDQ
jgi:signal transduction histidine kinase